MSKARQLADLGNVYDDGALSNRNMVINGGMTISQRGSSTTSFNVYLIDRFRNPVSGITQYASTLSHDTDAPSGFSNSLKVTTTTAETAIDAGDLVYIAQEIEGYNLQRLGYGASDAKTATLSFWVKSSVTGTYGVGFYQYNGTYNYTATYSISAANTWEFKTIKLSGNTSNSIANDNAAGVRVSFILAAGSTYNDGSASNAWETYATDKYASGHVQNGVVTTLNATWQLTAVQLEIGDTATPFEHPRSYGDELARCERYYQRWDGSSTMISPGGIYYGIGQILSGLQFKKPMRANPSMTVSATDWASCYDAGTARQSNDNTPFDNINRIYGARINISPLSTNGTAGRGTMIQLNGSDKVVEADAEL